MKLTEELKQQIRIEFIQGISDFEGKVIYPSLESLCKKYQISKTTLFRHAKEDSWRDQKDDYLTKLNRKLDTKRQKELLEESTKIDKSSISIAKAILVTIGQQLAKHQQDTNEGKRGINANNIHSLANAALTAQKVAKLALGESTNNVNINATINEQPLQQAIGILDELKELKRTGNLESVH